MSVVSSTIVSFDFLASISAFRYSIGENKFGVAQILRVAIASLIEATYTFSMVDAIDADLTYCVRVFPDMPSSL